MNKKCLFIINPSSGQNTIQSKLDRIIGKLILNQIVNSVDVFYTEKKDDGYNKAFQTNQSSYDFFVSVGGDGTLNEVIAGMVDSHKTIPLYVLAAGTVNDFANYLNLPTSTDKIVDTIKQFKTMSCDVAKINDHYFINVAAGGMFSDISFEVSKKDKKRFGPLAYYMNGLVSLPNQLATNLSLNITIDGRQLENIDSYMFAVTNTSRVGGFDGIVPYADIQDGFLDLIIIKKCSITDLIALIKDYRFGKHANSPFIIYDQGKDISISCNNENVIIDTDGEKGTNLPVHIQNVHKAITIIVPNKTKD